MWERHVKRVTAPVCVGDRKDRRHRERIRTFSASSSTACACPNTTAER